MKQNSHCEVTFTKPEQAELLSAVPDPRPLEALEVTGRTLATVISAGTELAIYRALPEWAKMPYRPGYAAVFEVEAVGSGVTGLKPGDRAFCLGPHRSFQRVQASEAMRLPTGLAPEQAVFARLMQVTMTTLATTTARPPAKVLVTGLGLVGHLAAQMFASCGYEVTGCDPSESRRAMAQQAGVARVLPAVPLGDPAYQDLVDLVIECSAHEQAAFDGCRIVRKRGEVVLVGTPWEPRTALTAFDVFKTVFHRYAVIRSGWEWELPWNAADFRPGSLAGNLEAALTWLVEGRVRVDGLYTKVAPRQAQQSYQDLMHQRTERLAVVFDWTSQPGA